MTATTMTLDAFLAEHSVCRVWYVSVGSPAGSELVINTDEDAADEDYCDEETLLGTIPDDAFGLEGEVSQDADGEWRWEADLRGTEIRDCRIRDCRSNTIQRYTVWGQ